MEFLRRISFPLWRTIEGGGIELDPRNFKLRSADEGELSIAKCGGLIIDAYLTCAYARNPHHSKVGFVVFDIEKVLHGCAEDFRKKLTPVHSIGGNCSCYQHLHFHFDLSDGSGCEDIEKSGKLYSLFSQVALEHPDQFSSKEPTKDWRQPCDTVRFEFPEFS